ncbi:MAG: cytochrome c family protein [Pseudomonadota bacterium]
MRIFASAVAISAMVAACSDGGSADTATPEETVVVDDAAVVETDDAAVEVETAAVDTADVDTADVEVDVEAVEDTDAADADDTAAAGDLVTKDGVAFASLTGDASAGKTVFAQCRACHAVEEGVNRVGPSLAGVVGRTAGSVDGYNYSPANANSGLVWTPEQLYVYLEDPRGVVPGTKMVFPGLKRAQQRADVIAYLQNPA